MARALLKNIILPAAITLMAFTTIGYAQDDLEQQVEKIVGSITEVLKIKTFVDANLSFCIANAGYTQEEAQAFEALTEAWNSNNTIDNLLLILTEVGYDFPNGFERLIQGLYQDNLKLLENRAKSQAAGWCEQYATRLASEAMNLKRNFATELLTINNFHATYSTGFRDWDNSIDLVNQVLESVGSPSYMELMAAGIEPGLEIIETEFRCYGERAGTDSNVPDFVLQIQPQGRYQSSFGSGTFVEDVYEDGSRNFEYIWTGRIY